MPLRGTCNECICSKCADICCASCEKCMGGLGWNIPECFRQREAKRMDIKEYREKVIAYIDGLDDEEFDAMMIRAGIENCLLECERFGNIDWDSETCVDCSREYEELFDKCLEEHNKLVKSKYQVLETSL